MKLYEDSMETLNNWRRVSVWFLRNCWFSVFFDPSDSHNEDSYKKLIEENQDLLHGYFYKCILQVTHKQVCVNSPTFCCYTMAKLTPL